MKTILYTANGEKGKEIQLPTCFSASVREDLIYKYLESKKVLQPYGNDPRAGKKHSASGIIKRRRHVWKSSYGRGISRVPRKIMLQRGSQFNWVGAEVSGTRGGRRSHPPRPEHHLREKKINKKEERLALFSAIAATAQGKYLQKHYARLQREKQMPVIPFVMELSSEKVKTKSFILSLKKMLGSLSILAIPQKSIRAGRGKMRGRIHKQNAGILIVVGSKEQLHATGLDIKPAKTVSVKDLAKGGPGRLTLYTSQALQELEERTK